MADNSPASLIVPAYVPNHELLDVTKRCLWSLQKTTASRSYELIIVDNGSFLGASEWLREEASEGKYLRYEQPIGYARAANIGLAAAKYDWLCVINTDIEFQRPWLGQLQRDYLKTPGGILAAMDELSEPKIHFDWSWFSCWITRRQIVEDVGYFDESLGFRFHDQDYAIRVRQAGYEVMRDGNVQVKHINSATYDTMNRNNDREEELRMVERWGARDFAEWLRVAA